MQLIVLSLIVLSLFFSHLKAKFADDPHDMRMEDFEISRKQWNKKESKYFLKFSRSGEVIKTTEARHRSPRFTFVSIFAGVLFS